MHDFKKVSVKQITDIKETVDLAGAITVESTVGAGTTVALSLPRVVPG